ncbi:PP2C family protein-serine/threonine phosphatase [Paracoccus pacificus]|uniref:PP2C family protein-serine/threonine phosphatase n=1 Tax=Paracoccus pacificus TaxID=1463598 RepID=A0ABW4R9A0_9RHOB
MPDKSSQSRRLVLLVDDSRAHRRVLAIQLRRAGYDVAEAGNAAEALDICAGVEPDFIISDWVLSGMQGPEFCRLYRQKPRQHYCYFILLTSKTDKHDLAFGLKSGADDFLVKPVSGAELLARVAAGDRILAMDERLRASNRRLEETLTRLQSAQDAIERDLREARMLQEGLLVDRNARFGDFDLSLLLRSAGHIGGDLIGFFPINEERVGIYAIDVSGHGVTAALLTARLAVHLSGSVGQNIALYHNAHGAVAALPPADLAKRLNAMMIREIRTDSYFTMVYLELDVTTGGIRLVQAGHPYPVIQRRDGRLQELGSGGLPVGVFAGAEFEEISAVLEPGDRLFLASDGITEATDAKGRQLGDEGLRTILQTNAKLGGSSLLESLAWSVAAYSRGVEGDDVSAILLERSESGALTADPARSERKIAG